MTRDDVVSRTEEFEELRPLLFSLSYRVLGSAADAEDAVQEAWLRYAVMSGRPRSPKALLSAVVTRISIDVLRSARVRKEKPVGEWLREPLMEDLYEDPVRSAELVQSVSTAALLLMERLSPLERAVLVLRDVFAYEFAEVAAVVGRSQTSCRQLLVRARCHLASGRARFEPDPEAPEELAARLVEAFRGGDVEGLEDLLAGQVRGGRLAA